ncbi:trans-aconitate 2-methyltransferase [Methylosinus sporium]|uniref:trans-aconitate 2-methyltransferase n=1 Tax=Methylosinus sporium TaxID=428 RepID=UPI00383B270C
MSDWDIALYRKYERERTRAAGDLLARIPEFEPTTVFDLGCGPANSTELLAARFPRATLVGLDTSDEMLEVARRRGIASAQFQKQDIAAWRPAEPADLVFSNAALQFVPDHDEAIVRLLSVLRPGGWLAVQMPNTTQEMSHALMRMIAADGPWAERLVPIAKTRPVISPPEEYYRRLAAHASVFETWQTTYVHPLDGAKGVVEWFEGSALRPFLDPLNKIERSLFLSRYESELAAAYPLQPDGKVLLRYPRLFFVAQKS